jgi:hypothetical protein
MAVVVVATIVPLAEHRAAASVADGPSASPGSWVMPVIVGDQVGEGRPCLPTEEQLDTRRLAALPVASGG